MLSGMLINRPLKVHNDMESQVTPRNVSRVCEISKALLQDPTKIERIEILLSSAGEIMLKPKATAEQEMEQPLFDPAVVRKLGDLLAAWVWGWLRQICVQHPPTCELISAMSINGTNVKHLRQAATGLPDAFELDDGMMEKNTMAAYLSHCHQKRGAPFAQLNLEDFVVGKVVHFTGGLGCFRLEKDEGSERAKYVIHQCTAGDRRKVNIIQQLRELHMGMKIQTQQSFDDYSAHIVIARQKHFLYTFFDHLKKPKVAELCVIAKEWCEARAKNDSKAPSVAADLVQAAKRRRSTPGSAPTTAVDRG